MSMLTRLVLLLTVLALLPFGSFAPKFGTGPRPAAVISAQLDNATVAAISGEETFASVQSRCKGQAVPGSPCNPAVAVWLAALTLAFNAPVRALHASAWSAMIGHTPPQPLGPPRLV